MDKAENRYFVAGDYDLTLRLQGLFHETVALQVKLDNAAQKRERVELALQIKSVHNEISVLIKEMKGLLADTEIVKTPATLTLSTSKRSN